MRIGLGRMGSIVGIVWKKSSTLYLKSDKYNVIILNNLFSLLSHDNHFRKKGLSIDLQTDLQMSELNQKVWLEPQGLSKADADRTEFWALPDKISFKRVEHTVKLIASTSQGPCDDVQFIEWSWIRFIESICGDWTKHFNYFQIKPMKSSYKTQDSKHQQGRRYRYQTRGAQALNLPTGGRDFWAWLTMRIRGFSQCAESM